MQSVVQPREPQATETSEGPCVPAEWSDGGIFRLPVSPAAPIYPGPLNPICSFERVGFLIACRLPT